MRDLARGAAAESCAAVRVATLASVPPLYEHGGIQPRIHPGARVAPSAVVSGNVSIGAGASILHGAVVAAEGGEIAIGERCAVLENAVVRATARWSTRIGRDVLVGPCAHVVGCTLEDEVFVATGAAVFHAAVCERGSEVRVHGVVHVRSRLVAGAVVPIGWVAVGDPARVLPPGEHERIWALQEPLDFPGTVYGVPRRADGTTPMAEIMRRVAQAHRELEREREVDGG